MTTVGTRGGQFKDREELIGAGEPAGESAGSAAAGGLVLPDEVLADLAAQLVARARAGQPVALTGRGGLLSGVIGQVLQAGLGLELEEHLATAGQEANGRNGFRARVLKTEAGPVTVSVPRDRAGTFDPVLVAKGERRTAGISGTVVSLYGGGMSVRDIARHCQRAMGIEMSHDTISRITDGVLEEMRAWQSRPLEAVYPVVFVDALVAKVRDGGSVRNKAVNIAVGIDCEGIKRVLGIWVAPAEGAKAWAQAFAQLRNRGLEDVIICCCDGLSGLGEEITAAWPAATVQTCTVHLIRAASRYGSYTDRKGLCAAMRPVYTACDMDAAEAALLEFSDSPLGKKYPAAAGVRERAWDRFVPFLEFAPPIRKVIYTTNAIESFNRQMRKVIKTRGHFPNDDALVKLLWLGIVDIEERRADERARQAGKPGGQQNAAGHLIEGAATQGWREALAAFDARWPGRIPGWAV
ncbi:MAG TPA: IS256 family transposase [Streptosporangiaceae bacterium]|nr:IS256 family transposase [Streptosporangiaceae bacterium]